MAEKLETVPLGIVLERRESDHPWLDYEWAFVSVIPGAPHVEQPRVLRKSDGVTQFHAATLDLDLHRAEAEAYHYNLTSPEPSLFVVLREDDEEESGAPIEAALVTASPYEAQDYLDSSEDIVERILLPSDLKAWVENFVDAHYAPQEFKKRKRDRVKQEDHKFGQETLLELRRRMGNDQNDH